MSFDILNEEILKKNNRTVMGLDPSFTSIPPYLLKEAADKGLSGMKAAAYAAYEFCRGLIDCAADLVAAVKPQSAYFEQYGIPGMQALADIIAYARNAGLYVILDAKRGDIGATSEAYAAAAIGETELGGESIGAFGADCVTVNPYFGTDGVMPFVKAAEKYNKSIFVLAKTSNPSSGEFQNKTFEGGATLFRTVADKIEEWGAPTIGDGGYTRVGAVVGATYPRELILLRKAMPHTFLLVPGYGAQGGAAADVAHAFDKSGAGAVVNASRSLMCAYKKAGDADGASFRDHTRAAVIEMRDDINSAL